MRQKHKPQRTCIACRQTADKRGLIRIVRTPAGRILVDPTGKLNGRGAYLCLKAKCWEKGVQQRLLGQALKVTPLEEDLIALQQYYETDLSKT